jgi:hypothetical protein
VLGETISDYHHHICQKTRSCRVEKLKKPEEDQTKEDDVKTCNNYNSENGKQRKSFEVARGKYLIYRRKKIRNTVCFSSETMR